MSAPIRIELPTVFEVMTVNAWLFLEPEPVLVDCGEKTEKSWNALLAGLEKHGLSIQDIKKVIITHAHLDHMGMANKITQHSAATIWVSEYVYDWAVDLQKMLNIRTETVTKVSRLNLPETYVTAHFNFGYEVLAPYWEEIPADRLHIFSINDTLEFGGQQWDVIHTPGHCVNQTCFFQPESGYLFSADMLLKMIPIPIIDAQIGQPNERVKCLIQQLSSYQKLLALEITKVFPGHYEAFEQAKTVIEEQIARVHRRKEHCWDAIQDGRHQFLEIWQAVYQRRINPATFFMIVGLLDLLEAEGRIETRAINGRLTYFEKKER